MGAPLCIRLDDDVRIEPETASRAQGIGLAAPIPPIRPRSMSASVPGKYRPK